VLINGQPSATGFIVNPRGDVLTCFHVIESAAANNYRLEIQLNNGEIIPANYLTYLLKDGLREAIGYDCFVLIPQYKEQIQHEFLSIGTFNDVQEGDQLITVGYPLTVKQAIISTGILSTKWSESNKFIYKGSVDSLQRDVAWLDLTMNRGNSGGPIIKLGLTPSDDKVIGIATFILNPYGPIADQLVGAVNKSQVDITMGGISQNGVTKLLASAVANNSIGVSGCISIDHVTSIAKKIK